jgi:hypothetical protein
VTRDQPPFQFNLYRECIRGCDQTVSKGLFVVRWGP